jgi:desulfoferrodoxin (superoxide reductase-like protein)
MKLDKTVENKKENIICYKRKERKMQTGIHEIPLQFGIEHVNDTNHYIDVDKLRLSKINEFRNGDYIPGQKMPHIRVEIKKTPSGGFYPVYSEGDFIPSMTVVDRGILFPYIARNDTCTSSNMEYFYFHPNTLLYRDDTYRSAWPATLSIQYSSIPRGSNDWKEIIPKLNAKYNEYASNNTRIINN